MHTNRKQTDQRTAELLSQCVSMHAYAYMFICHQLDNSFQNFKILRFDAVLINDIHTLKFMIQK